MSMIAMKGIFEGAGEKATDEITFLDVTLSVRGILVRSIPNDQSSITTSPAHFNGLSSGLARRMALTFLRATRLVEIGKGNLKSWVTHTLTLEHFAEAFDFAGQRDSLKVVIIH